MIFPRKTRIIPRKTAQRKVKERKVKERKENESKENKIKVARLRQQGAVGNRPRRQYAARLSAAHTQMEQFDYDNIVNDIRISLFSSKLKVQSSKLKAQSSKLKAVVTESYRSSSFKL